MAKRIYTVVVAAIKYKNTYLLTRRVHSDKTWHDKWQLPGGTLEFGESIVACLKREIKEELGVEIKKSVFVRAIFEAIAYGEAKMHIVLIPFLCQMRSNNFKVKLDSEASTYNWFTVKQISRLEMLKHTYDIIVAAEKIK